MHHSITGVCVHTVSNTVCARLWLRFHHPGLLLRLGTARRILDRMTMQADPGEVSHLRRLAGEECAAIDGLLAQVTADYQSADLFERRMIVAVEAHASSVMLALRLAQKETTDDEKMAL